MIPLIVILSTVALLSDPFHPGESDSMMLMVEEYTTAQVDEKSQGIQLFKGWNLVSFNIKDDPDPVDPYFIEEIFTEDFFDRSTDGTGPDKVCRYDFDPNNYFFPFRDPPNFDSWNWQWEMEWAYAVLLDDAHLIELSESDWWEHDQHPGIVSDFAPDDAWDVEPSPEYWFFLAMTKSRQVEVLPDPESSGPFYGLYDPTNPYNNNTLRIVKSDDGRYFRPNLQQGSRDEIGYLEPGRGYYLGFSSDEEVQNWPFCNAMSEEAIEPGSGEKEGTDRGVASSDPAQPFPNAHFHFKGRTHWWYPIIIDTLAIEGMVPEFGDEIGVFDGALCVGATLYEEEFPISIAAWRDDIATPEVLDGYSVGNEIIFKYFDKSENQEFIFEPPPSTQAVDDPIAPRHSGFDVGFYAIRSLTDGIANVNQLPREYFLGQNYPNPFNAETVLPLQLPERSNVKVDLYNIRGQHVARIYEGIENAGYARIRCNANNLSSGVYLVFVTCEGLERNGRFEEVGKILLLK